MLAILLVLLASCTLSIPQRTSYRPSTRSLPSRASYSCTTCLPSPLIGTCVDAFIGPNVSTLAFDVVVAELSLVARPVCEVEHSLPVLLALTVLSVVLGVVWPILGAVAILLIVLPLERLDSELRRHRSEHHSRGCMPPCHSPCRPSTPLRTHHHPHGSTYHDLMIYLPSNHLHKLTHLAKSTSRGRHACRSSTIPRTLHPSLVGLAA